jgi:hypothetical protein
MTKSETKAPEEELTLEEYKQKIAELEKQLEKKNEEGEGWLIITPNPAYDGKTAGILFTNGMAFLPKNMVLEEFTVPTPPENQLKKIAKDREVTLDVIKAEFEESSKITTVERAVRILTNDFGYKAQFYTVADLDKLRDQKAKRALERAEVQSKLNKQSDMLEKLIVAQRM